MTHISVNVQRGDDIESKAITIKDDAAAADIDAAFKKAHDWLEQQKKRG